MADEQPASDFRVGQELWFVPEDSRNGYVKGFHKVEKVGRKWLAFGNRLGRVNRVTLHTEPGAFPPGQCYRSKEEWETIHERDKAWGEFNGLVRDKYRCPPHLTTEQIRQMTAAVRGTGKDG